MTASPPASTGAGDVVVTAEESRERRGRRGRNAPIATLALGLLLAWQLWLILHHVFWRDELQAYLIVRDSPGLGGLFASLHYEGHPSLWYLLLAVTDAILHRPAALAAAQVAIALSAAAIVWLRAPFPPWLRLQILAGYFPLFEYGVIARSYGLGALLLWAWLPLRRTIWGWLILALMANVAVHFALLSACCAAAVVLIERRWSWAGLGFSDVDEQPSPTRTMAQMAPMGAKARRRAARLAPCRPGRPPV